jgi:asparagine synthase (glutamine-hydrolysing)
MCGIAGNLRRGGGSPDLDVLCRMARRLGHRGPDAIGVYRDDEAGLCASRLAIVDPPGGQQPRCDESGTIWVVCNGEIYNHHQLRRRLTARGHVLRGHGDIEVLAHLYEEEGEAFLERLNGEFAIALWDSRRHRLLLARDRLGIRPLHYQVLPDQVVFASEVKSLLEHPAVRTGVDLHGLGQFLTFWTTVGGTTLFQGVHQVLPGHCLSFGVGPPRDLSYWSFPLPPPPRDVAPIPELPPDELRDRLDESVTLRLPPDGPVGVYVSGGIDSAAVLRSVRTSREADVRTFSVAFDRPDLDESGHQAELVRADGVTHHELRCTPRQIAEVFPDVVWHAEAPLIRTAPAPMYLLARAVHEEGLRVVLSGEGADEVLLGYDVHRAAGLASLPAQVQDGVDIELVKALLRSDPYVLPDVADAPEAAVRARLAAMRPAADDVLGVHRHRWTRMARARRYLSPEAAAEVPAAAPYADLAALLPAGFADLDPVTRAQLFDVETLLRGYLLSSQGDRMSMAHGVEGRLPFLDHTLVEYAATFPADRKLVGLVAKQPLRRAMAGQLPPGIVSRPKYAYTAPGLDAFLGADEPDYVAHLLSREQLERYGLFAPDAVAKLAEDCRSQPRLSQDYVSDFVAVLSTQLLVHRFLDARPGPPDDAQPCRVVDRSPLGSAGDGGHG